MFERATLKQTVESAEFSFPTTYTRDLFYKLARSQLHVPSHTQAGLHREFICDHSCEYDELTNGLCHVLGVVGCRLCWLGLLLFPVWVGQHTTPKHMTSALDVTQRHNNTDTIGRLSSVIQIGLGVGALHLMRGDAEPLGAQ